MLHFMCQLVWATGYPCIWTNIILDVTVMVFWGRFTVKSVDWVKQMVLSNVGGTIQSEQSQTLLV